MPSTKRKATKSAKTAIASLTTLTGSFSALNQSPANQPEAAQTPMQIVIATP